MIEILGGTNFSFPRTGKVGNTAENLLLFNFGSKKCGFVFQQINFERKYIATRNYEKFRLHN